MRSTNAPAHWVEFPGHRQRQERREHSLLRKLWRSTEDSFPRFQLRTDCHLCESSYPRMRKKSTQKKLRKQSLESTESEIVCVLTNQSKNPCNLQHLNTQKGIISVRGKLARLKGCSGHA